jgi:hypothetical protein
MLHALRRRFALRHPALCSIAFAAAASAAFAWSAVADAATYNLRPDTTVSNQWVVGGAPTPWEALDDAVTQPTSVTSADYIYSGGAGRVSEVGLTTRTLAAESPSSGRAWFFSNTASTTQTKMEVIWGGSVRATYNLAAAAPFAWRSVAITPPTQAAIDDLRLRFTTPVGGESNVRAAYFELVTAGDTTPPDTSISAAPPASTSSTSASFSFASTEANSTFDCKLDAGAWAACASPKAYSGLAAGSHTFSVRARDVAGNVDATPAVHTWTISGCTPAFGSFGVDNWPPACWRPYAATSPFNRQIPEPLTSAQIHPNSPNIVKRVTDWGAPAPLAANEHDTSRDSWHPTYYASSTDPLFSLDCTTHSTCERSDGVFLETLQIRIPDAARAAAGSDGHLTVVDQASGWEYDFYEVISKPAGGGTLQFVGGGGTRIDGDGRASYATVSRFGNLAGIIRAQELEAGNIDHALFMVVKCSDGSAVYPAMTHPGTVCGSSDTNAPPMGARFQLNMSDEEINLLPATVPPWRKTIYRAMARYGMYFGDTGGGSTWGIQIESDTTYSSFGRTPKFLAFAQSNGWPSYNSSIGRTVYTGDFSKDIDWATKLRVVAPCVGAGTC